MPNRREINGNSCGTTKSEPKSKKLIVFDWDDTLFPTTEVKKIWKVIDKLTPLQYQNLTKLSKLILKTLTGYIKQYKSNNIRIVTASENGAIKRSLLRLHKIGHFRDIYNLIFIEYNIKIYHPKQCFLPFKSSQDVYLWKYIIFCELFREFSVENLQSINTFVSIGDSFAEFEASKAIANLYQKILSNVFIHRLKLIQYPSIIDMMQEISLILTLCGVFELESLKKKRITIDYDKERKKHGYN